MKKILLSVALIVIVCLSFFFVSSFCLNNGKEKIKENKPGEFSNGQKYETYKTDDFEIKYPNWPNIDKNNLLEPEKTKLAVANAGCNFIINVISVPANTSFKNFIENSVQEQITKTKSKIITKDIKDSTARFEGEVIVENITLHSVSYGYMTSKRQSYGIGFIAEKSQFKKSCEPLVQEVIDSISVK